MNWASWRSLGIAVGVAALVLAGSGVSRAATVTGSIGTHPAGDPLFVAGGTYDLGDFAGDLTVVTDHYLTIDNPLINPTMAEWATSETFLATVDRCTGANNTVGDNCDGVASPTLALQFVEYVRLDILAEYPGLLSVGFVNFSPSASFSDLLVEVFRAEQLDDGGCLDFTTRDRDCNLSLTALVRSSDPVSGSGFVGASSVVTSLANLGDLSDPFVIRFSGQTNTQNTTFQINVSPVPLPPAAILLVSAVVGIVGVGMRRRSRDKA